MLERDASSQPESALLVLTVVPAPQPSTHRSASHVPKPGYLRRLPSSALVSAEPSSLQPPTAPASEGQPASEGAVVVAAAVAAEMAPGAGRRLQAVNHSIEDSLDTHARRCVGGYWAPRWQGWLVHSTESSEPMAPNREAHSHRI